MSSDWSRLLSKFIYRAWYFVRGTPITRKHRGPLPEPNEDINYMVFIPENKVAEGLQLFDKASLHVQKHFKYIYNQEIFIILGKGQNLIDILPSPIILSAQPNLVVIPQSCENNKPK